MNLPIKFFTHSNFVLKTILRCKSTIFALSSGKGKCGVAVIRISGVDSSNALCAVANLTKLPEPRVALLKNIYNPITKDVVDKGLILWFPGPKSYTGEDSFELQIHGGAAVIAAVLKLLSKLPNMRIAEPGEFTKRAFYNSKLDLTEVEGIADLLDAETEAQRKQAVLQSQGALRKVYDGWRTKLRSLVAQIEAEIDFGETDRLNRDVAMVEIYKEVDILRQTIDKHLTDGRKGERLRNGAKTVIIGEPNVGKSSLLNALTCRPAAIVADTAGTTRDTIDVTLNIAGYPMVLTDTAGLRRKPVDDVEREGIKRALISYTESDLVLLMFDAVKCRQFLHTHRGERSVEDYVRYYVTSTLTVNDKVIGSDATRDQLQEKDYVMIANKVDLVDKTMVKMIRDAGIVCMCCQHQEGVSHLVNVLEKKLQDLCGRPTPEHPCMSQIRHRHNLSQCKEFLDLFMQFRNKASPDTALVVETLRQALFFLGQLTGKVSNDEILDVIFKDFCIGK